MGKKIIIKYEGNTPGLDDHRLDIESFIDSLKALASAVQESAMERGKLYFEDEEKIKSFASRFRLQLDSLEEGSLQAGFVIEAVPNIDNVFVSLEDDELISENVSDIADDILDDILINIKNSHAGERGHKKARRYLNAIPKTVENQTLMLVDENEISKEFKLEGRPKKFKKQVKVAPIERRRLQTLKIRVRVVEEQANYQSSDYKLKLQTVGEPEVREFKCDCSQFIYEKSRDYVKRDAWALLTPHKSVEDKYILKGIISFYDDPRPETLPTPEQSDHIHRRWGAFLKDSISDEKGNSDGGVSS